MRKIFLALLAFLVMTNSALHADDLTISDAVPYNSTETPQWLKDIRRGEIITLGSWPFTVLLVSFGYSIQQAASHNWNTSYIKNPFSSNGDDYSFSTATGIILTSLGISVGIGLTDFIVNSVHRGRAKKNNNAMQLRNITIMPLVSEQERLFIPMGEKKEYIFGNLESAVF